ncbi:transposase, partial [Xenorhabdus hominickii]|uniref:transposase n=1 Tax=Xenorhabdus hominickii TaxID=351679 RepID=UPI001FCF1D93
FVTITAIDVSFGHALPLKGGKHITTTNYLIHDQILGATVEIAKRNELHTFRIIPNPWIVERSFAWLDKCRRLWKNCERYLNTRLQFVNLAFLVLLLCRKDSELMKWTPPQTGFSEPC